MNTLHWFMKERRHSSVHFVHTESVHRERQPHLCSSFGKRFSRRVQLRDHISVAHEGKKSFKYLNFGYRFGELKGLITSAPGRGVLADFWVPKG